MFHYEGISHRDIIVRSVPPITSLHGQQWPYITIIDTGCQGLDHKRLKSSGCNVLGDIEYPDIQTDHDK